MLLLKGYRYVAAILLLAGLLSACAVRLVSDYDPSLYNRLTALNEETLTLFSALSSGATAASFSDQSATYDKMIGGFDALRIVADARPTPGLGMLGRFDAALGKVCGDFDSFQDCIDVTPDNLELIVERLSGLRDRHKSSGLGPNTVAAAKQGYEVIIAQLLSLEAALKR